MHMKTNDEIRRENLKLAITRVGTAARLAALSETAPAYLSQIKNQTQDSKSGTPKAMGDDIARRIEVAIREQLGWMDADHSAENEISPGKEPIPPPAHTQWIRDREARLLDLYRCTDDRGQNDIMRAAESAPNVSLLGISSNNKS